MASDVRRQWTIWLLFLGLYLARPAPAQVNIEKMRMTEPEGLAFTFSVNYSLRAGNQDRSDLGAGSRLDYKAGRHYVFLLGNLNYGISQGVTYKNRSFAHHRYN
jgi:hypothetical protein